MEVKGYTCISLEDSISFKVGNYKIRILRSIDNESCLYERINTIKSDEEKISEVLKGVSKVCIHPIYPIFYPSYPKKLSNYLLIDLETPINIAPSSSYIIYTLLPVDIALYAIKDNTCKVLDVIPISKAKYTLYGPLSEGVIARYSKCKLLTMRSEDIEIPQGKALTRIRVENKSKDFVRLRKILVDASMLKLYYIDNTWKAFLREILVTISSQRIATITYADKWVKESSEAYNPPEFKAPIIHLKTTMPWGL